MKIRTVSIPLSELEYREIEKIAGREVRSVKDQIRYMLLYSLMLERNGIFVRHENSDDADSLMDAWRADWQNTLEAWFQKAKGNKDTQSGDVRMITIVARSVALYMQRSGAIFTKISGDRPWPDYIHEMHFSPDGRLYSRIEWCEKVIAGDIDPRDMRNFGEGAYTRLLNYLLSDFDT